MNDESPNNETEKGLAENRRSVSECAAGSTCHGTELILPWSACV
jgi:hypothetical protein